MIELRKAIPEDAVLLASVRQKAWDATYRGIYPDEMIDHFDYEWHIARETANLQNPIFHTYLLLDGTECRGYFTYLMKEVPLWRDFHVRLLSLYLLPSMQKKGLGRTVLEFVQKKCREAGYEKLYLSCHPENTNALSFYQHMGGKILSEDIGHKNPEEDTIELEFNF